LVVFLIISGCTDSWTSTWSILYVKIHADGFQSFPPRMELAMTAVCWIEFCM